MFMIISIDGVAVFVYISPSGIVIHVIFNSSFLLCWGLIVYLRKNIDIAIEQHILVFTKLLRFNVEYTFGLSEQKVYIRCV